MCHLHLNLSERVKCSEKQTKATADIKTHTHRDVHKRVQMKGKQ